ncbi:hypothetical protein Esti_002122 [Eimeria stiedai]
MSRLLTKALPLARQAAAAEAAPGLPSALSSFSGGGLKFQEDLKNSVRERGATEGDGSEHQGGPAGGGPANPFSAGVSEIRSELLEEHRSFSEAFDNEPVSPLDEFGQPSCRPAVRVEVQRVGDRASPRGVGAPSRFNKPRFNVKGLEEQEGLHAAPSLWQQLLQQEREARARRQARSARRTATVLGSGSASREGRTQGQSLNTPLEASRRPSAFKQGVNSSSSSADVEWRPSNHASGLQAYELKGRMVTAGRGLPPGQREGVQGGGPPQICESGFAAVSPAHEALEAMDQRLGAEEVNSRGEADANIFSPSQLAQLSPAAAAPAAAAEGETVETDTPEALATHAAGMQREVWERLQPQHLRTQQLLLRARSPEDLLAALGDALTSVGASAAAAAAAGSSTAASMAAQAAATGTSITAAAAARGIVFSPAAAGAAKAEGLINEQLTETGAAAAEAAAAARRHLFEMYGLDPINAVTGVHRLAKIATPFHREQFTSDQRFGALLAACGASLPALDSQGVSNLLWGLARLELGPPWLQQLLLRCTRLAPSMSCHQLSACLYSLSRVPEVEHWRELLGALKGALHASLQQLQRPLDLTCICVALARLQRGDTCLFQSLAERARELLPQLSPCEMASVSWAFAAVGVLDKPLFAAVQRRVETEGETCLPGDIVQLSWALARAGTDKQNLFDYTLSPLIRGNLMQFNARQLTTIVSSYAQAGIQDFNLLSDVSVTLLPHVSSLSPQQLASLLVSFSHLGYSNREVISALSRAAHKQLPAFSPQQLARVVYGLGIGGCRDARLFEACCTLLQQRLHALSPGAITQALVGLCEADQLMHPAVKELLKAAAKKVNYLFAEDCAQLLLVASKVHTDARPPQLVLLLQQQLHAKLKRHWCLDLENLCDLLHALLRLRVGDSELLQMAMRRIAYLLETASTREFLRLIGCLAALQAGDRLLVRSHIQRRLKVQAALSRQLETMSNVALDPDSKAALLFACAQLGFCDDAVSKMTDELQHQLETEEALISLPSLCHFLWANTEMNLNLGWTRSVLRYLLARRYSCLSETASSGELLKPEDREAFCKAAGLGPYRGGELLPRLSTSQSKLGPHHEAEGDNAEGTAALAESLLRLAFVCVSLGEEAHLMALLKEIASLYEGRLPSDLLLGQQVALHVNELGGPSSRSKGPSALLKDWVSLVLGAPRHDVYHRGGAGSKANRLRVKDYNFDAWLSEPLIQMRIPHKTIFVVKGIYRVSVAFPLEKHLIDVLTFQDLLAPSGKPTATAELRQRQLALLGWTVHSVHLRCLYTAVLDCNLRSFVAQIAAACCPQAAEAVSFEQQQRQQEGGAAANGSKANLPVAALVGEAVLENLPCLQRGKAEAFELNDDMGFTNSSSSMRPHQQPMQHQQQQRHTFNASSLMRERHPPRSELQLEASKEV